VLEELKKKGYRLAIVSNNLTERIERFLAKHDILKYFLTVYHSILNNTLLTG